jgi:catecholate siderophore receptor
LIAFAAALAGPAAPAEAAAPALSVTADAAPSSDTAIASNDEQAIVVTGQRTEYGARSTRAGTRTDTDIRNVPQAMTVISESQIEDQSLRSIADILTYVPGAAAGSGESNRDQITLRGNNTTADFFLDGIRDDAQYFRDLYNLDRVEVLRGPNAMIFGRGGGGGVVNRVTKRSSGRAYREFALSGDSEGGVRLTGDVDTPLGGGSGLRVNGLYENGESFRRNVELERYGINPTAGLKVGPSTRIDLAYEYFHDRRTADRGLPSVADPARLDRPLEGYDRVFFGDPEQSYSRVDAHIGTFAVEHEFGDGLTLRNRTSLVRYDKFYQNIYPSDLLEATNQVRFGAYNSRNDRTNLISQTDLVWENDLAGIDQTLLLGFEVSRQRSRNQRSTGSFLNGTGTAPLSNPTVDADVVWAPIASDANNRVRATVASVYIQDQIRLSPAFEIVAGLRFDRFSLDVNDLRAAGGTFERNDEMISPRLGLIVRPFESVSLYGSYSRSFLPSSGDQFSSLDATTQNLEPERFENLELGAKWSPIAGLLATVAVYRLDRTNTRAVDPVTLQVVQTGAQRSRGIEFGLERNMSDRWQISAGYALQGAEIRRTTSAAPAGRTVPLVPRHQFSLWNRYDLTDRLGVGLGLVARSKVFTSISNQVILPGYARVDAAAFFEIADGIEAQVNVENLTGADYFLTSNGDNNLAPGAPRTARATIRFTF